MKYKHAKLLCCNDDIKADIYWILNPGRAQAVFSACIIPLNRHRKP
jgi:hypothetical protein